MNISCNVRATEHRVGGELNASDRLTLEEQAIGSMGCLYCDAYKKICNPSVSIREEGKKGKKRIIATVTPE